MKWGLNWTVNRQGIVQALGQGTLQSARHGILQAFRQGTLQAVQLKFPPSRPQQPGFTPVPHPHKKITIHFLIVIFNPLLLRLSPALLLLLPPPLVSLQLAGSLFARPLAMVFAGAFFARALFEALAVLHQGLCRGDKRYWLVAWKGGKSVKNRLRTKVD